jgi:cytochrome c
MLRLALLSILAVAGCEGEGIPASQRVAEGDPERGRLLIVEHGCQACHRIPGVRQASGSVGPPLAGFGRRAYIAGILPNRPMLLTRWLQDPPAIDAGTAMPAQGLSAPEARHVAAYLYTLR